MKEEALKLADDMEGRAKIRRQATDRKSVQEGANDRLSDQLEEASAMIRRIVEELDKAQQGLVEASAMLFNYKYELDIARAMSEKLREELEKVK